MIMSSIHDAVMTFCAKCVRYTDVNQLINNATG